MGIGITGVGAYVPDRVVTNAELATRVDTSHEWIVEKTGIRERRLSEPDEAPSDMGCQAALRCLRNAGVEKAAVDPPLALMSKGGREGARHKAPSR